MRLGFIPRPEVAKAFEDMVSRDPPFIGMMVQAYSGLGKTTVLDKLEAQHRGSVPIARVLLSPASQDAAILRAIAHQLASQGAIDAPARLDAAERENPLIQVAPRFEQHAKYGGAIESANQTMVLDGTAVKAVADITALRVRRMEAFLAGLAPLSRAPFVIAIDQCEHLRRADLARFVLDELLPTLHQRMPTARVYLSGQEIPVAGHDFARDYERLALLPFTPVQTRDALTRLGVADAAAQDRVQALTDGHPLLFSMLVQALPDGASLARLADGEHPVDLAERVRWIHERVVKRFEEPQAREIAPDLSLLEWFDLGILRRVFGAEVTEAAFDEMIGRSFVHRLAPGRWRCHDVVRKHMGPARLQSDPDRAKDILARAYEAFLGRRNLADEVFDEARLAAVTAAFACARNFSASTGRALLLEEIAYGIADGEAEHVHAFAYYAQATSDDPATDALAIRAQRYLEALMARSLGEPDAELCTELADGIEKTSPTTAGTLCLYASYATPLHVMDRGTALARRAIDLGAGVPARLQLAELTAVGDRAAGEDMIDDIEGEQGESMATLQARIDIARQAEDGEAESRLHRRAVATFPKEANPSRIALARGLHMRNDLTAARTLLDDALAIDPTDVDARMLLSDIYIGEGNGEAAMRELLAIGDGFGSVLDAHSSSMALLNDPTVRAELYARLRAEPDSIPPVVGLVLMDSFATEGAVTRVDDVAQLVLSRSPALDPVCRVKRSLARLAAGESEEAITLLGNALDTPAALADGFLILAAAHAERGRIDAAMAACDAGQRRFPFLRSQFSLMAVRSLAGAKGPQAALDRLAQTERLTPLSPMEELLQAELLSSTDPARAEALLVRLIQTENRRSLPLQSAISARFNFGMLIANREPDRTRALAEDLASHFEGHRDARIAATVLYARVGDLPGVRRAVDASSHLRPADQAGILMIAGAHLADRFRTMEALLAEVRRDPTRMETLVAFDVLVQKGATLDPAVAMTLASVAGETMARVVALNQQAVRQADPSSILALRRAVAADPADYGLRINLIQALRLTGEMDDAIAHAREGLDKIPQARSIFRASLIELLIEAKRADEAETLLAPDLARHPLPPEIRAFALRLAILRGTAAEDEMLARIKRDHPEAWSNALEAVVDSRNARGDIPDALRAIAAAEKEGPLSTGLLMSKANALAANQDVDGARLLLSDLIEDDRVDADDRAVALSIRAGLSREAGDLRGAADDLLASTRLAPRATLPRFTLSRILHDLKDYDGAYEILKEATMIDPSLGLKYAADLDRLARLRGTASRSSGVP